MIIIPKVAAIVKIILATTISKEYCKEAVTHTIDSDKVINSFSVAY